jgi:branched-subunit amino acid transport protein AzlD
MEIIYVYIILAVIVLLTYGLPFLIIKKRKSFFIKLGLGTILFYLLIIIVVLLINLLSLDNGKYPIFEYIALAFYASLPFILIINLLLIFMFLIKKIY